MDRKIKCVIIDDEPIALALLEKYVSQTPYLELVGKCSNAKTALEFVENNDVEVVFTDIQMPDLSGMEFSKMIPKNIKLVFTTAFDEYAVEGFRVDAMDYLLKPFDLIEFQKAAYKVKEWFELVQSKNSPIGEEENTKKFLFVKSEYKQIKIDLNKIDFIEGLKDYAKIWITEQSKPILTLMSLKKLEEELPANQFMRIHRSFIISLDKIEKIERNQVVIRDKFVPISDQYKEVFQDYVKRNSV